MIGSAAARAAFILLFFMGPFAGQQLAMAASSDAWISCNEYRWRGYVGVSTLSSYFVVPEGFEYKHVDSVDSEEHRWSYAWGVVSYSRNPFSRSIEPRQDQFLVVQRYDGLISIGLERERWVIRKEVLDPFPDLGKHVVSIILDGRNFLRAIEVAALIDASLDFVNFHDRVGLITSEDGSAYVTNEKGCVRPVFPGGVLTRRSGRVAGLRLEDGAIIIDLIELVPDGSGGFLEVAREVASEAPKHANPPKLSPPHPQHAL